MARIWPSQNANDHRSISTRMLDSRSANSIFVSASLSTTC